MHQARTIADIAASTTNSSMTVAGRACAITTRIMTMETESSEKYSHNAERIWPCSSRSDAGAVLTRLRAEQTSHSSQSAFHEAPHARQKRIACAATTGFDGSLAAGSCCEGSVGPEFMAPRNHAGGSIDADCSCIFLYFT